MKLSQCPVCERQTLGLRKRAGRFIKHRMLEVEVPSDVEIPECDSCGARPISYRLAEKLDPILQAAYDRQLSSMINADLDRLAVVRPLYQWERDLGLSKGYLSKVRESTAPSVQLLALVRLLANNPGRATELQSLWSRSSTAQHLVMAEQARYEEPVTRPLPARMKLQRLEVDSSTDRIAA